MTDFATLNYVAVPVGPISAAALSTSMSNVPLDFDAITEATGCVEVSDSTAVSGGNAVRTIVFGLTYSCFLQLNGNNLTPNNSAIRQYYVITTSGAIGNIGDLFYDNGSSIGRAVKVPAVVGRTIITANKHTNAFSGGTVSLTSNHQYTWNGTVWVDNGVSTVFRSAFQNNFPVDAGNQAYPFNNLYTHALGAGLGSVITSGVLIA